MKKTSKKDARFLLAGLRQCLRRFDMNGHFARQGRWSIGNGGYSLLWELCYENQPVLDCTDCGFMNHLVDVVNDYGHSNIMEVIQVVKEEFSDARYDVATEYAIVDEVGEDCIPFNRRILHSYKDEQEARKAYAKGLAEGKSWSLWSLSFVNGNKEDGDWDILSCYDWAA